ncbi:MAG: hypothetical protein R3E18_03260 [Sphingomonadaceae bacterium]
MATASDVRRMVKSVPVASQSIMPFGAATTRINDPHYTDQAPLLCGTQAETGALLAR